MFTESHENYTINDMVQVTMVTMLFDTINDMVRTMHDTTDMFFCDWKIYSGRLLRKYGLLQKPL